MPKSLHIALIRQRYVADGGAEGFVTRALALLRNKNNAQITLVTRAWDGSAQSIRVCNPFYLGSLWRDWSFARAACRAVQDQDMDLVQAHERVACCDIYRAGDGVHREWLRQRRRTLGAFGKLRLNINPYHYYVKAAETAVFESPRLRAVICNSRMVKAEIKQYFHVRDDKLHVIYNGVDTIRFNPSLMHYRAEIRQRYKIPSHATLFLFVGSGFERKGVAVLLEALALLPDTAYLLLVGRDKKLEKFRASAIRLGIDQRVIFAGIQKETTPFYGAADAFVLPTLYDPFPNVAFEAMASGLPIITSLKCGAAELIKNGENGYSCDALDKDQLASYMDKLLAIEHRKALGMAARHTVSLMDLNSMSQKLLALYESLL